MFLTCVRPRRALTGALALLLLMAACGEGETVLQGPFPNQPGGNPLVPELAAYPFPSDFYLVTDSSTETGYRVQIPEQALPKNLPSRLLNAVDGFSRIPIILAFLPGGIAPTSLPDPTDHGATVKDDSPVLLLRQGTWERVPVLAERDMMAAGDATRALIIRPLRLLAEKAQYVVILRDKLRDAAGRPHQANEAFKALRDDVRTDDQALEQQRQDFVQVRAAISALGLRPEEVVLAWTFRTRSDSGVTGDLLAMQQAANRATLGAHSITSDQNKPDGTRTNRQIVATLKAPNFVKGSKLNRDSDGNPLASGTRDVSFGLTLPSTIDSPRPVILYGHGFLGGWIQGTRGNWNETATTYKYNTAGTNIGFHEDLESTVLVAITVDMNKMEEVVAEVLQAFVNVTTMGRLVKEKLADEITAKDSTGKSFRPLDASRIYYHGISNGGTFGLVVAATCPVISRASIIVGGGGLTHFLQRAVQWNDYAPLMRIIYPNALDQQLMMSMVQQLLDPVDSMNFADKLVTNRASYLKPIQMAMHMAVNDCQVNNLVTEWVARTADVPLITPSPKQIYGLRTITAPAPGGAPAGTRAAMFVYDEKVTPTPLTNVPPKEDNRAHGTVRELPTYRQHVSTFLEQGKFVQVCSGPCDPN